jgi:hypothetical protein
MAAGEHKDFPWPSDHHRLMPQTQNSPSILFSRASTASTRECRPILFWNNIVMTIITMKELSVSNQLLIPQQYVTLQEGNESSSSFNVNDILPKKQIASRTAAPPASHRSPAPDDSIKDEEKPRRSVSFNPNVRCRIIQSRKDMSDSQISKNWLNRTDIAQIKQDCKQVLYLINADLKVEGMGERGVEHLHKILVQERRTLRTSLLHEICLMQELQSKLCQSMHERCVFSDAMAERCVRLSVSSQKRAYQRAHSDAAEASRDY